MIPVKPQLEPTIFNQKVRIPGNNYLRKIAQAQNTSTPKLKSKEWTHHDYWGCVRVDMYDLYKGICAYSAHWIPRSSNPNVDHFIAKSADPWLAYEWTNYRLACPLVNIHKKDYPDVLDPFSIQEKWFFLEFPSLIVKPNPDLPREVHEKVQCTICRLKLNEDEAFIDDRNAWLERYCLTGNFNQLKRDAPFIAYELERQNLVTEIKNRMHYSSYKDD